MGQLNFRKPFEFRSFSEIFYCGMTKLRNTNLRAFMSVNKNHIKKQNYGTESV